MVEIVVFGSAIVDFICYVDRLPNPGETLVGTKFTTGYGGKGANQCVAAAKLGASTALIAKVGNDIHGTEYLKQLRKENVNIEGVEQCTDETTGIAQICVAGNGENHIVIVPAANNRLSVADYENQKTILNEAKVLICQLETPPAVTLEILKKFEGMSILNAAPAIANIDKEFISTPSIFCVNETEAELITGYKKIDSVESCKPVLMALLKLGANIPIITMGAQGAVYTDKKNPEHVVHVPVPGQINRVVDTTGAGDAFIGALAYFMVKYRNSPFHQQIGGACEMAAYSVQHPGTQPSYASASNLHVNLNEKKYNFNVL